MAQFVEVFVDTYSGNFVRGFDNVEIADPPGFHQGDTFKLRIYLLKRTSAWPITARQTSQTVEGGSITTVILPYEGIDNSNGSLRAGLGPKNGVAGSILQSSQFTWDKGQDSRGFYFEAFFPVNTDRIGTLIGDKESAQTWFEIEYTEIYPWTVLSKKVTVEGEVLESGNVVTVPANQTAMTVEQAMTLFLSREIHGALIFVNDKTGHKCAAYLGDDDEFHADPIPPSP